VGQDGTVNSQLDALQPFQQQNLYKLFTLDDQFTIVGNPEWNQSARVGTYNSFEAVHDQIHGYIGGHMGDVRFSSFDPIFWLHHA
jgi:tyrosinase